MPTLYPTGTSFFGLNWGELTESVGSSLSTMFGRKRPQQQPSSNGWASLLGSRPGTANPRDIVALANERGGPTDWVKILSGYGTTDYAYTNPWDWLTGAAPKRQGPEFVDPYNRTGQAPRAAPVDGNRVDQWLAATRANSPLIGLGGFMADYAAQRGVSVPLVLGLMLKETQLGSDGSQTSWGNNFGNIIDVRTDGGLGGYRTFLNFATPQEGLAAMIDLLAGGTYAGKSLAEQVGAWYVGPRAFALYGLEANDTGGYGPGGNGTVREYIDKHVRPAFEAFGQSVDYWAPPPAGGDFAAGGFGFGGDGDAILARTSQYIGMPYTNEGIRVTGNPADSFDCSSFTGYVLGLPRDEWLAQTQYDRSQRIDPGEARAGDLVFFHTTDPSNPYDLATHVGIYLGDGRMINSQNSGVQIADLSSPYWREHFLGFGRY